jgi:DNA-binding CsgD family transcriptional regulator
MAATDWELFTESISQAAVGWQDSDAARLWAKLLRAATTQQGFLTYLEARRAWDISSHLAALEMPVLVLSDERNALADADRSRELTAAIPDARLLQVSGDSGMPDRDAIDEIRAFLGESAAPAPPVPLVALTPREEEVLALAATGASNAEIAEQLSISVNTVTRHLTHIYAKTGATNRVQAIRYANLLRLPERQQ